MTGTTGIRWTRQGPDLRLEADTNADRLADVALLLTAVPDLRATDLILG